MKKILNILKTIFLPILLILFIPISMACGFINFILIGAIAYYYTHLKICFFIGLIAFVYFSPHEYSRPLKVYLFNAAISILWIWGILILWKYFSVYHKVISVIVFIINTFVIWEDYFDDIAKSIKNAKIRKQYINDAIKLKELYDNADIEIQNEIDDLLKSE